MATPKQEKLVTLLLENYGSPNTRPLGELLLEAGYSENSAKNPKLIIEGKEVQEGLAGVAADLNLLRQRAIDELKARDIEKEPYRDVVKAVDVLTKNHQLLTGGETERIETPMLVKIIRNDGKTTTNSDGNTGGVWATLW